MRRFAGMVIVVLLLSALAIVPASATPRTAVFQANVTVPVFNVVALGTLTVMYDDMTGAGTWNFQGTINGQPANASGAGTFNVSNASGVRSMANLGESTVQMTMTSIDQWNMPRFSAYTPRTASVRTVGELAYIDFQGRSLGVAGIPLAINPPLSFPVEGTYVVTDAASGQQPIKVLPGTGAGPGLGGVSGSNALPITIAMLIVLAAVAVVRTSGRRLISTMTRG